MKDQYFGDVNDYLKYGLLRAVIRATGWRVLVAWYLTADDGRRDGRRTSYLTQPQRWRVHDPILYDFLQARLRARGGPRGVRLVQRAGVLPGAVFHGAPTPDARHHRARWFAGLLRALDGHDLAFLDPDNGMQVPSLPMGRRGSCKYAAWDELAALWSTDTSLVVYQHFPRRQRATFIQEMKTRMSAALGGPPVSGFRSPNVLFLVALQSRHRGQGAALRCEVARSWAQRLEVC